MANITPARSVTSLLIPMFSYLSLLSVGFGLGVMLISSRLRRRDGGHLPPGPRGRPVIGNLPDLTLKEPWLRVTSWAETFGDVVFLCIFGQGIVFLNTVDVASDLLDKRGAIYSDKPRMVMCGELLCSKHQTAFARYGENFRRQRRMLHYALGPVSMQEYQPLIMNETCAFLQRLLNSEAPASGANRAYQTHVRRYIGGLILSIVYGYRVTADDDPHLERVERTLDILSNHLVSAGTVFWLVDFVPSLRHLPAWFPFAGFQRKAAKWRAYIEETATLPFEWVKENMRSGASRSCFCTMLWSQESDLRGFVTAEKEDDIRWTASTLYLGTRTSLGFWATHERLTPYHTGSIDTTLTLLCQFLLAMVLYPDIAKKAQEEIDGVVGYDRLPTLDDRPALPYLDALLTECMRWGLPKMSRDPALFRDPDTFAPERYLEDVDEATAQKRDPRSYIFGFGRRRCPGALLAESNVWVAVACMLATLDFHKATDAASGKPVEPKPEYCDASFRLPTHFPCDIMPRSERVAELIREAAATAAD
ncbi:cytochrome P450 [Trametes elegans]|nr:cytochrome P450 [Trametes elegans]